MQWLLKLYIGGVGAAWWAMSLCPVWPLSVKVESSAEAYGKPPPFPRLLTIEGHLPPKPSIYQTSLTTLESLLKRLILKSTDSVLFVISLFKDIGQCLAQRTAVLSQHALASGLYALCKAAWPSQKKVEWLTSRCQLWWERSSCPTLARLRNP